MMEEKEVETVAQHLSEWSCGQPCVIVGGNVATQLTLQVWFGKGAVLSLKAVPGYDFVFKKEKKKRTKMST